VYVYGPVPSRRLGRSLGVSPIPPKTCTFSCVYCQLGRTDRLSAGRESFFAKESILKEIIHRTDLGETDFVTFCGDGEPTLCRDLGWLIRRVKSAVTTPVAVITNSSLLYRKDVRQDLEECDLVIASLDAGDERTFRKINRPHGTLDFRSYIQGLMDFTSDFTGKMWVETMLVRDVNDSEQSLERIRQILHRIKPDGVHLLTPTRPPAEPWVRPPEASAISKAREIIESPAVFSFAESGDFGRGSFKNARQAIIEISSRHPLRLEQALNIEEEFSEPGSVASMLEAGDLVQVVYNEQRYLLPARVARGRLSPPMES
jgi:wyosine [tRNA(Phe)-imidazoG37] synthetase (radical SAM superfamily)